MNYCSLCGGQVAQQIPTGDNRLRHVCNQCGHIHYLNPKIVAGCLPVWEDRILLCKRAIEPRLGLWTLPAGFMENGETTQEAAKRETREEALAEVELEGLYTLTSLPHINQVQMIYLARLIKPEYGIGEETADVGLFREEDIPWDNLAFVTIRNALAYYLEDRKQGTFPLRHIDLYGAKLAR